MLLNTVSKVVRVSRASGVSQSVTRRSEGGNGGGGTTPGGLGSWPEAVPGSWPEAVPWPEAVVVGGGTQPGCVGVSLELAAALDAGDGPLRRRERFDVLLESESASRTTRLIASTSSFRSRARSSSLRGGGGTNAGAAAPGGGGTCFVKVIAPGGGGTHAAPSPCTGAGGNDALPRGTGGAAGPATLARMALVNLRVCGMGQAGGCDSFGRGIGALKEYVAKGPARGKKS